MTAWPDERSARAWLSARVEPGLPAVAALVTQVGASEAVRALATGRTVPGVRPLCDPDPGSTATKVLAGAARRGLRWVCPGDEEWPVGLDALPRAGTLHARGGLPYGLWVRGVHDLRALCGQAVAVVGCRASTAYGDDVTGDIAAGLAEAGIGVVSGAAYGIDAAAHRGALAVGGRTVAVLACGADVVYPRGHEELLHRTAAQGVVVSEAAPGAHPTRIRFLARNRLIAALCQGVLVVEAAWRSGALTTLKWAERLGRVCLGVPGPVTSTTSAGVHLALREHRAELVTSAAEVREAVAPIGSRVPGVAAYGRGETRMPDLLPALHVEVLEALPVGSTGPIDRTGSDGPVSAGRLAADLRLTAAVVEEALAALQRAGLAEPAADGGWRRRLRRAALPEGGGRRTLP